MSNRFVSVLVEVFSAFFLLLSLYPLMRYGTLAGIDVPQHFSKGGCVDAWTTRVMFIYLGLIFAAMYILLSLCRLHPNWINLPFSGEQARASLAPSIAGFLKLWCMAQFAYLSISAYRIALGKEQCLNNTIQWIIILCAAVHLGLILAFRKD